MNKTTQINLRISEPDKVALEESAKASGMSLSKYLVMCGLAINRKCPVCCGDPGAKGDDYVCSGCDYDARVNER